MSCRMVRTIAFLLLPLAQVLGQEAALRGASELPPLQVLVFDAGSSGTRIHVFNFVVGERGGLVPKIDLEVRDRQTKKIKPGLSHYAENSDYAGAEKSITELMQFASQWVPADRRASTPVLLKATAGLRSVKPASKADAVLDRVRETLQKSGYLFKQEWAAVIKGKEEAGLAWVAANYLQGSFRSVPDGKSSLGVIEMGGGSTQVTFEVGAGDASHVVDDDNFSFTNLAGVPFKLYAHSYLGYGQDHALARMRSLMLPTEDEDPCYPVGYMRPHSDDPSRFVRGTGNAELCQQLIKTRLLAPSESAAPGQYSSEMALRGRFAATENFFYVRNDLKIPLDGSLEAMKEGAKKGCEMLLNPSEDQEAAMKAGKADQPKGCFGLAYQAALLETLRARAAPDVQVDIARNINGGDIDWAMGAALMHFIDSGMWKSESVESDAGSFSSRVVVMLLIFVLATGAARFFLGPKHVAAVTSALRAATIGRSGFVELKSGDRSLE